MNPENYSNIAISWAFESANWQNFADLLRDLYNPLSLRTFRGSSSPPTLDSYTRTHWDNRKDTEGFSTSIINNANEWHNFAVKFYDKDDEYRFINIEIDLEKKTVKLSSSLDNEIKREEALNKIQKTFIIIPGSEQYRKNNATQSNNDILDLKPNVYGIGINFNEVWKRFKNWFLKKNRTNF